MSKRCLIIALFISLSASFGYAGLATKAGHFLNIMPGARPVSLGGAFTGLADDINTIYWNPAGLSLISTTQAMALYNSWFEGIGYEYLSYARPGQRLRNGCLGLSLTMLQIDNLERRDSETNMPINTFEANDLSLTVAYGLRFNNLFSIGANMKYLCSEIDSNKGRGVALDAGALFNIPLNGLRLGLSIQNLLRSRIKIKDEQDELGLVTKIGLGYKTPGGVVNLAADYSFSDDKERYLCLGAEYWLSRMLALRAGYSSQKNNSFNFNWGLGIKVDPFHIDYAYVPYQDLGATHRLSLLMNLYKAEKRETARHLPPSVTEEVAVKASLQPGIEPALPVQPAVKKKTPELETLPLSPPQTQQIKVSECPVDKHPLYVVTSKNLQMSTHIHQNSDPNFVKVYIQLKNMSLRETFYTNLNFFTLITETGRYIQYSPKTFGGVAYFQSKDLPPQGETEGSLLFETSEKPLKLLYQDIQDNSLSVVIP